MAYVLVFKLDKRGVYGLYKRSQGYVMGFELVSASCWGITQYNPKAITNNKSNNKSNNNYSITATLTEDLFLLFNNNNNNNNINNNNNNK